MRILIAAGGSGGHIFPAIALGRALKVIDNNVDLLFVGSNKALDRRLFEKEGVRSSLLTANKMPYGLSLRLVPFIAKLLYDVAKKFFCNIKI
jgi:UDP-N-acetylglucosamine:LPS N-acetylglucosamine transferase